MVTKYILVSGGVLSGLGKGIVSSSIGMILKDRGLSVCSVKCDPYLNVDCGTMSPYEHGETFVLADGGEVDLDFGNYERFIGNKIKYKNSITSGKIFKKVIENERKGKYLGKTVQIIPHVTNEIIDWIKDAAKGTDICIIELGGTIGDIESMHFIEALRQMKMRFDNDSFLSVHVSLIPSMFGEQKTKPTQNSVKKLRSLGIEPDIIITRSEKAISKEIKEKLSLFCFSNKKRSQNVIDCHNVDNIFKVPLLLLEQDLDEIILEGLSIKVHVEEKKEEEKLVEWKKMLKKNQKIKKDKDNKVKICLIGKYTNLNDSLDCYFSVQQALNHACHAEGVNLDLLIVESSTLDKKEGKEYEEAMKKLESADGVLIPGGFGNRGIQGKIEGCRYARENKYPFLGICLGFQIASIEYARNVLGLKDANSTEFDEKTKNPIVIHMPEINKNIKGGNMRLGEKETLIKAPEGFKSRVLELYGSDKVYERHRHRYEINAEEYMEKFESKGLKFVGRNTTGERMEILELSSDVHPYFVATQYHLEFNSSPMKAHPLFVGLIHESIKRRDKKSKA